MKLRGIDFGHVLTSAGARNFFGNGYWFHRLWPWSKMDFSDSTFVSKTTTLRERVGNMPLGRNQISPKHLLPKCIKVYWRKGLVLNAVGLSGPGLIWLLESDVWQKIERPFFISFMSVADTANERHQQLNSLVEILRIYRQDFKAEFGLEINYSCPNVGLDQTELLSEVAADLEIGAKLGIPLVPNFNAALPVEAAVEIAKHPACDAISCANTLPYGTFPDFINWQKLFGKKSPLAKFGGGGLSGWPLLPIVQAWVWCAKKHGITKPIIAGGGVLCIEAARQLIDAGASAIKLGTVCILRPWRVNGIIECVNQRLGERESWEATNGLPRLTLAKEHEIRSLHLTRFFDARFHL